MIEIIEHKGYGHPDTICDTVVEKCSKFLDEYYQTLYNKVLHYNVDKALFLAGDMNISYNYIDIIKPPSFILGGQISKLDYRLKHELEYLIRYEINNILPNINNKFYVEIRSNNVSNNLNDISMNESGIIYANDTSFCVAHYPYTESEVLVLNIKNEIKTIISNNLFPIGEDFKIMKSTDYVYISTPVYYNKVNGFNEYLDVLNKFKIHLETIFTSVKFKINPDSDNGFPYLTACGSSIECGDDGQVGRGNRFNGLITPMMPMTMEAYSGKNNKNHTGKIYQQLAFDEAKRLYVESSNPCKVTLISKIGKDINDYDIVVETYY